MASPGKPQVVKGRRSNPGSQRSRAAGPDTDPAL